MQTGRRLDVLADWIPGLGADSSHPGHQAVPDENLACGRVAPDLRGVSPRHPHEAARFSVSAATGAIESASARSSEDRVGVATSLELFDPIPDAAAHCPEQRLPAPNA
jgi:hypothetical protein